MWINAKLFDIILGDNRRQVDELVAGASQLSIALATVTDFRAQKTKDDITIDWMRHRINALEKLNAQLLMKVTGIFVSVPEIVPTRPGTITDTSFDYSPSFEDVGDEEASRLKISYNDDGSIAYNQK